MKTNQISGFYDQLPGKNDKSIRNKIAKFRTMNPTVQYLTSTWSQEEQTLCQMHMYAKTAEQIHDMMIARAFPRTIEAINTNEKIDGLGREARYAYDWCLDG